MTNAPLLPGNEISVYGKTTPLTVFNSALPQMPALFPDGDGDARLIEVHGYKIDGKINKLDTPVQILLGP